MKKIICLVLLSCVISLPAFASNEGRSDQGPLGRVGTVFQRGILNVLGLPVEIVATPMREAKEHPKLWPLTAVPKTINNIFIRGASAVNDALISPFLYAPYTSDISPITEPMGLPEYAWQIEQ